MRKLLKIPTLTDICNSNSLLKYMKMKLCQVLMLSLKNICKKIKLLPNSGITVAKFKIEGSCSH